jgi:hypothetical protein
LQLSEKGVRRLRMDILRLLVDFLFLIGGGAVGHFFGVRQNRESIRYEQQTRAVTGIRNRLGELQQECLTWPAAHDERLEKLRELRGHAWRIVRSLEALETYYEASKPWLESRTREKYERIGEALEELAVGLLDVLVTYVPYDVGASEDASESIRYWARNDSPGGLPELMREWDAEVERVIGSRTWPRLFR